MQLTPLSTQWEPRKKKIKKKGTIFFGHGVFLYVTFILFSHLQPVLQSRLFRYSDQNRVLTSQLCHSWHITRPANPLHLTVLILRRGECKLRSSPIFSKQYIIRILPDVNSYTTRQLHQNANRPFSGYEARFLHNNNQLKNLWLPCDWLRLLGYFLMMHQLHRCIQNMGSREADWMTPLLPGRGIQYQMKKTRKMINTVELGYNVMKGVEYCVSL